MECDICNRKDVAQSGMHCAVCVRTTVYQLRIDIAKLLFEKEAYGRKVEQITSLPLPGSVSAEVKEQSQKYQLEIRKTDLQAVKQKLEIQDTAKTSSRSEIQKLREDIEKKRASLAQRRQDLASIKQHVPGRKQGLIAKLQQIERRGTRSFDSVNNSSVDVRGFLCRESASLLGMKQKKVKDREGNIHERFSIAGHIIPDLRFIHNTSCTGLTAVLATLSHLVILVSFYLGVRLPAEIILPHRDYPLATISHPSNSYLSAKVPFPGSGSNVSLSSSPASSRYEGKALSKPRPLFIGSERGEALSVAAKHDPTAYKYFLEGLSLLAWDVMWLGHSQGFAFGKGTWEDSCNIGRNLWQLVFSSQQSPSLPRTLSSRETQLQQRGSSETNLNSPGTKITIGKLGEHSHDSAHNFLGYASNKELHRALNLSSYTTIFDSLRKALEVEIKNAEWILLSEQEFDDGEERFDLNSNAVNLQNPDMLGKHYDQTRSVLTTMMRDDQPSEPSPGESRTKGKSGWTMVKNRDNRN